MNSTGDSTQASERRDRLRRELQGRESRPNMGRLKLPVVEVAIWSMTSSDIDGLATAFRHWPKDRALFEFYDRELGSGVRDVVVALADGAPIGYLTIKWTSDYPPFRDAGIPEISDFKVLPAHRRQGVGTRLLVDAEHRISGRSATVGIGVGLYRDYGSAQRMYVARGYLPDGNGVVIDGELARPGSSIVLDDSPVLMFTKQF